jgi:hypothetical protein
MTKIYTISGVSYNDRVQLIKQFRADFGPIGSAWSFCTNSNSLEIHVKYPDNCAYLSFLMLKYGDQIKVRTG